MRRGLESLVAGTSVVDVEVRRESCTRRQPGGAGAFADALVGASFASPARRGKFMWVPLLGSGGAPRGGDGAPLAALSAHLGMSGQFRAFPGDTPPEPHPHCRARLTLAGAHGALTLDFLDQRTFGYLTVEPLVATRDGQPAAVGTPHALVPSSVAHIGRDALDPYLDDHAVRAVWRRGERAIKQVLLDQTAVSGIGNIYADEALWRAKVHPGTPAASLAERHAGTLLDAVREVMARALAQGGTSFDALYVNVNGESGYFARDLEAYGRGGHACSRCGTLISRAVMHGRSTHWCPRCQRRPRAGTARD